MTEEQKPKDGEEKPKEKVQTTVNIAEDGTLTIVMPLSKIAKPMARGNLLEIDGLVCHWYNELVKVAAQRKNRIVSPGGWASMKRGLSKVLKH